MNGSANGGADLAAISAITPHICIRELEKISILPLVNIRSASRGALGNLPRRRSRCSGLPVTRRRPKTSRETRRLPQLKRRSGMAIVQVCSRLTTPDFCYVVFKSST